MVQLILQNDITRIFIFCMKGQIHISNILKCWKESNAEHRWYSYKMKTEILMNYKKNILSRQVFLEK